MDLLCIISKWPEVGRVKQRLARKFGQEKTTQLCIAFLGDLISHHKDSDYKLKCYIHPREDTGKFSEVFPDVESRPQMGDTLDEILFSIFSENCDNFKKVIVIRSDLPTIGKDEIEEAIVALDRNDYVLGPSESGGFYLIGMKRCRLKDIFQGIDFERSSCFSKITSKLERGGVEYSELDPKMNITTYSDLLLLKDTLLRTEAEKTFSFLAQEDFRDLEGIRP